MTYCRPFRCAIDCSDGTPRGRRRQDRCTAPGRQTRPARGTRSRPYAAAGSAGRPPQIVDSGVGPSPTSTTSARAPTASTPRSARPSSRAGAVDAIAHRSVKLNGVWPAAHCTHRNSDRPPGEQRRASRAARRPSPSTVTEPPTGVRYSPGGQPASATESLTSSARSGPRPDHRGERVGRQVVAVGDEARRQRVGRQLRPHVVGVAGEYRVRAVAEVGGEPGAGARRGPDLLGQRGGVPHRDDHPGLGGRPDVLQRARSLRGEGDQQRQAPGGGEPVRQLTQVRVAQVAASCAPRGPSSSARYGPSMCTPTMAPATNGSCSRAARTTDRAARIRSPGAVTMVGQKEVTLDAAIWSA